MCVDTADCFSDAESEILMGSKRFRGLYHAVLIIIEYRVGKSSASINTKPHRSSRQKSGNNNRTTSICCRNSVRIVGLVIQRG